MEIKAKCCNFAKHFNKTHTKLQKKNNVMTDAIKLKTYFDNLSRVQYPIVRAQIAEQCGVSRQTVTHWENGRNKIPLLAKKEIERIAKQKIFEV